MTLDYLKMRNKCQKWNLHPTISIFTCIIHDFLVWQQFIKIWSFFTKMVQITFSIYFKSQNKLWKWVQHPKVSIFTCITHLSMPNRIFFIFLAIFGKFRQKTSKISILCTFFSLALDWSFKCNPRRIQKSMSRRAPWGVHIYPLYMSLY